MPVAAILMIGGGSCNENKADKWKTAGNSLENGRKLSAVENVFHAVKTSARTVFAASALGVLLAGTAFAAAGEDAYQMAEERRAMRMSTTWRICLPMRKKTAF